MSTRWIRTLGPAVALAFATVQLAPGGLVLASVLTLVHQSGDHTHAVSLVAEAGHLEVVLSHDGDGHHHDAPASHPHHPDADERRSSPAGQPGEDTDRDHVVRTNEPDAADSNVRRTTPSPAPLAVPVLATPAAWTPQQPPCLPLQPRARSSDASRKIALRL